MSGIQVKGEAAQAFELDMNIPPLSDAEMKAYRQAARHASRLTPENLASFLKIGENDPTIKRIIAVMNDNFGGDAAQEEPIEHLKEAPTNIQMDRIQSAVDAHQEPYLEPLQAAEEIMEEYILMRTRLRKEGSRIPEDEFEEQDLRWIENLHQLIREKVGEENFVQMLETTIELLADLLGAQNWREIITNIYGEDSPEVLHLRDLMDAIDSGNKLKLQQSILQLRERVCDTQVLRELEELHKEGKRFKSWQEILRYVDMTATQPEASEEQSAGEQSTERVVNFERLAPAIRTFLGSIVVPVAKFAPRNAVTLQQPGKLKPGAIICMSEAEIKEYGFGKSTLYHEGVHACRHMGCPNKYDPFEEIFAMAMTRIVEGTNRNELSTGGSISIESLNSLYILSVTVAELRLMKLLMERSHITYDKMEEIFQDSFRRVHKGLALYEHVQDRRLMPEVILSHAVLADVPLMAATHLDFGDIGYIANTATVVFREKGVDTVEDQILYYLATVVYMSTHGGLAQNVEQFKQILSAVIDKGSEESNRLIQDLVDREIPLEMEVQ